LTPVRGPPVLGNFDPKGPGKGTSPGKVILVLGSGCPTGICGLTDGVPTTGFVVVFLAACTSAFSVETSTASTLSDNTNAKMDRFMALFLSFVRKPRQGGFLGVGQRPAGHGPGQGLPIVFVRIDIGDDLRGRGAFAIGQDPMGLDGPAIAVLFPDGLAEGAVRFKNPGADAFLDRVPADDLRSLVRDLALGLDCE